MRAPIGYGLGGGGANVTSDQDLNNITTNGWYAFSTPPANAPTQETDGWTSGYSYMLVASRDQNTVSQIVFASNQLQVLGCIVKRYRVNSEWSPWEWVNPPMLLGVEYRTSERYQGKPVYKKVVNFGLAPNTTYKEVAHGITDFSQLVVYSGMLGGANLVGHPFVSSVHINATTIRIETNADASGSYIYVILSYTKTSD